MLIFNVLGTLDFGEEKIPTEVKEDFEQPLVDLIETYHGVTQRNALETYHDAQQALDMAMNLFSGGYLPLEQRSHAENLYFAICEKIYKLCQGMAEVPEDLQALEELLSDTYFCNFSLFQSIPDSWAIKQLFPVMPIHRLNERPVNHAVLERHHLRLRRQARSVHRSPRREEDHHVAQVQRRAVLPRRVPGRRLPGDPRRPAQPVRRHARGAHLARRERRSTTPKARASSTSSRATPSARC